MDAYEYKYTITIVGGIIGIFTLIILYKYLTRRLSVSKIKHYLAMCIKTLGQDLKNSLIFKDENSFNFILEKYLNTNDENLLNKLASLIAKKHPVSKISYLTNPANVMRSFIKCICDEQLESTYENGYILEFINYEELKKKSPFAANFCFIANSTTKTYVDFICGCPFSSIKYAVIFAATSYYDKATKCLVCKNIFVPPKIIFLTYKAVEKYYYTFLKPNNEVVEMPNGVKYSLCSAIIRGGMFVSGFKQFGGIEFNQDEIKEIKSSYQYKFDNYFAVGAFKIAH